MAFKMVRTGFHIVWPLRLYFDRH